MKTRYHSFLLAGLASIFMFGFLGCGENSDEIDEQQILLLARQQAEAEEKVTSLLQTVTNESQLKDAWPKLVHLNEELESIVGRFRKMKRPGEDVAAEMQQFAQRLQMARARQKAEVKRIKELPGGQDFFYQIESLQAVSALNALKKGEKP